MTALLVWLCAAGAPADDPAEYGPLIERVKKGEEGALEEGLKVLEEEKIKHLPTLAALVRAVADTGRKGALTRLRELLEKTENGRLRVYLIDALARQKDLRALALLMRLAQEKDEPAGQASLRAVIDLAGRSNVDFLKKMLAHDSVPRRLIAAEELFHLDVIDGYPVLEKVLEEGTAAHRALAVRIAGGLRRKESVDLLVKALEDPEPKVSQPARAALIASLTALYPYLRFDEKAPADRIKAWWKENRPK
jgi:HEAT repeat protein